MRQLTVKQKKYLDNLIGSYETEGKVLNMVEDLKDDEWEHLVDLNDTEILWQEVNRYLSDASFDTLRINQMRRAEQSEGQYPRNNNKGPFAPF
jgi:DNA-directed RNA polymerase beta' subunit